jgi:hypothetical protein
MMTEFEKYALGDLRLDRFRQVMTVVLTKLEAWDQTAWHCVLGDEPDLRHGQSALLYEAATPMLLSDKNTGNPIDGYCGTAHCIAGWCDVLSGRTVEAIEKLKELKKEPSKRDLLVALAYSQSSRDGMKVLVESSQNFAKDWLGLTGYEDDLFDGDNTLLMIINWYYQTCKDRVAITIEREENKDRLLELKCYLNELEAEFIWNTTRTEENRDWENTDEDTAELTVFSVHGMRSDIPRNFYQNVYDDAFDDMSLEKVFHLAETHNLCHVRRAARAFFQNQD